jgi:flavin reductase (DIM6/NTAB) family NADH-FMN oxidoreductase RutF
MARGRRNRSIAVAQAAAQVEGGHDMTTDQGPQDTRALRDALGRFATGVTIVTAPDGDGRPVGFTANSFSSLSLDPPLVLWSPAKASRRFPVFARARHFAIHVLGAEQAALGRHFAMNGSDFALPGVQDNPEGVATLPDCLARFDCESWAQHDGGDHVILIGRVLRASFRDGAPLVFSAGRYGTFDAG